MVLKLQIFSPVNLSPSTVNDLLNQERASHRPVRAWFLKIVSVQTSMCVCACARGSRAPEAINN